MTARELIQNLSAFPPTAPLIAVWAEIENCEFEDGLSIALRVPHYEAITSISASSGGGMLLLHTESHDHRGGPARACRGAVTVGQLAETVAGGDHVVIVIYSNGGITGVNGVESVCAHQAVTGDGKETEYEFGDTGQVCINCQAQE